MFSTICSKIQTDIKDGTAMCLVGLAAASWKRIDLSLCYY